MTVAELIEALKKCSPDLQVESATRQKIVNVSQDSNTVTLIEDWMIEDDEIPKPTDTAQDYGWLNW